MSLRIKQLAIHYIDKQLPGPRYAATTQQPGCLDPTIIEFLLRLVCKVWNAADTGSTRSGHFRNDCKQPHDGPAAKPYIEQILQNRGYFLDASIGLADHLYNQTPATASPGLLTVLELYHPGHRASYLAILKIRHRHGDLSGCWTTP